MPLKNNSILTEAKQSAWQRLLAGLGVDKAIGYTLLGKAFSAVAIPITLFLLTRKLTAETQGYYYTFFSTLSITVIFELGFSYVIIQFSSHEKGLLTWDEDGKLEGDLKAKARLASLLRASTFWYATIAMLTLMTVGPGGYIFLKTGQPGIENVSWVGPWGIAVLFMAGVLALSPLLAVLEGCGLIEEMARFRLFQSVTGRVLLWAALLSNAGLYSAAMINLAAILCGAVFLGISKRKLISDLWNFNHENERLHWLTEVWPMQWRIGASWISGWLIGQLVTPVIFRYHGAIEAGRYGMTQEIMGSIFFTAFAWVNLKGPLFGQYIARGEYAELDEMFFSNLRRSLGAMVLGGVILIGGVLAINLLNLPWKERLMTPGITALVFINSLTQLVVAAESVYLRAHKKEPFFLLSITNGILTAGSTYFLGQQYGIVGIVIGQLFISLIFGVGWGTWIFVQKRRDWHKVQSV